MARINSYPVLSSPSTSDLLIATDVSETGNPTKTLSIQDLSTLISPAVGGATSLNGLTDVAVDVTSVYFNPGSTPSALLVGNPGGNVVLGFNAGIDLTTGNSNSLYGNETGANITVGFNNSAFGRNALTALTTGDYNTVMGVDALKANVIGSWNTVIGYEAGFTPASGDNNTLVGHDAGYGGVGATYSDLVAIGDEAARSITTANDVVAIGRRALNSITDHEGNTAVGFEAGRYIGGPNGASGGGIRNTFIGAGTGKGSVVVANNVGSFNVGLGYGALPGITSGESNIAIGRGAATALTTANNNVIIGSNATGSALVTGDSNIFIGDGAGNVYDAGNNSIGIGANALSNQDVIAASPNIAIGKDAGYNLGNVTGGCVIIGTGAGFAMQAGYDNTLIGNEAGKAITDGHSNVVMGHEALIGLTTGDRNLSIGNESLKSVTTQNQNFAIGHQAAENFKGSGFCLAIGYQAAQSEDDHGPIFAIGHSALKNSNAGASNYNTAVGHSASSSTTSGRFNTTLGYQAGNVTTQGSNNVIVGYDADPSGNSTNNEIVIGSSAVGHGTNIAVIGNTDNTAWHPADDNGVDLGSASYSFKDAYIQGVYYDTSGDAGTAGQVLSSTATGTNWIAQTAASSLNSLTDVSVDTLSLYVGTVPAGLSGNPQGNTTLGESSGAAITTGSSNTYIGSEAAKVNITGASNVAVGNKAMSLSTSSFNTAVGDLAIGAGINSTGRNHAIGYEALENVSTGTRNTASGYKAGTLVTTGSDNTFFGDGTGDVLETGSDNIYLGALAIASGAAVQNEIAIGHNITGSGSNSVTIGTSASNLWTGKNNGNIDIGSTSQRFKNIFLNTGELRSGAMATAPANASATGTLGDIRFTADHIYVCTATNTWKRVAIATF